jgi:pSer/pThr/pTyr-binding forkhead associated (FHA) protein
MMSMRVILKATSGDLNGQEFNIAAPAHCVLGRSRVCTLRLPGDATVSRQHCLIEVEEDAVWIQDLGSLNGTLVNGAKIGQREPAPTSNATVVQPPRQGLRDGDELRICNNTFRVVLTGTPIAEQVRSGKDSEQWSLTLCS